MKDSLIYYDVGPLLYCPGNNDTIANSIMNEKFGKAFSLAMCLEDTISENGVEEAEDILCNSMNEILRVRENTDFFLPKIFIRVRSSEQMFTIKDKLKESFNIISGFIIPKFSLQNADDYINNIIKINENSDREIYVMPIYENKDLVNLETRNDILYGLKEKLKPIEKLVLNIRIGGNDLCHAFGLRRRSDESIYEIGPVANILSDIVAAYGEDYIISAPVWEYYNGNGWEEGLRREIIGDKLNGFIGKTVIHPNQIEIVNELYKVDKKDFDDAKAILDWDESSDSLVCGSTSKSRMNEYNTHTNWALRTIMLSKIFGIK